MTWIAWMEIYAKFLRVVKGQQPHDAGRSETIKIENFLIIYFYTLFTHRTDIDRYLFSYFSLNQIMTWENFHLICKRAKLIRLKFVLTFQKFPRILLILTSAKMKNNKDKMSINNISNTFSRLTHWKSNFKLFILFSLYFILNL